MKLIQIIQEMDKMTEAVTVGSGQIARVVRQGEVVRRRICPPGKKLVDGRCVVMDATERQKRHRAAIKSNRKGKNKRIKSRRKALRIRKQRHL